MTQFNYELKSVDGMLGTWTWGSKMEGADESNELWRNMHLYYETLTDMKNYSIKRNYLSFPAKVAMKHSAYYHLRCPS